MKRIAVGEDSFRNLRESDSLYVDKSTFIREVLDSGPALLLPRPRRFGKTLNMTMLHAFFDRTQQSRALFEGLAIAQDQGAMRQLNRWPTIFLSLKNAKALSWEDGLFQLASLLRDLAECHLPQLHLAKITASKRLQFEAVCELRAKERELAGFLFQLTELLHHSTGQKVVLLIDEYDTPIHQGQEHGYYENAVSFFRGFLGAALKGNPHLERVVITAYAELEIRGPLVPWTAKIFFALGHGGRLHGRP